MTARRATIATIVAALLSAAACSPSEPAPEPTSSGTATDTATSEAPASGGTVPLTIMEFNIEYGGDGVDFSKVPAAIEASGADVVMVEEAFGTIPKIAEELGWDYVDNAHQLVSKFPIFGSPDDPRVAFIEVAPGKMAAITNVHLTSSGYGPNVIERKGFTAKQALKNESTRMKEITPIVGSMSAVAETGIPSFIVGDLNSPSHRDWTEEMVGSRPQVDLPVAWPVTIFIEEGGFTDSYREVHPDPVENPGLTWPAWRPNVKGWNPVEGFTLEDRIDYIYSSGPATVTDSYIMGEEGGPDVEKSVTPWPSDHRALISSFDLDLSSVPDSPNLMSIPTQLADIGPPLAVTTSASPGATQIVATPAEGAEGPTSSVPVTDTGGTTDLDTTELEAMPYDIQLQDDAGTALGSVPVWFQAPGAGPQVATTKKVYRVGEPITVTWYGAPANRWDWVGTFERNGKPGGYINYEYTEATVAGETKIDGGSSGPWPLEPGQYSVYLLPDDSYKVIAENTFVVKG